MKTTLGALILSVGLSGCHSTPEKPSTPSAQPRVVSLTPNLTEILFALEAGSQVVGVTGNDHFPPEVDRLPKIGDMQLNYEALLQLHPDLVVYDPLLNRQQLAQLQKLGLHLEPLSTQTLPEMLNSISRLGVKVGKPEQAARLVTRLREELELCKKRREKMNYRPQALVEIWHDPLIAAGQGSYCTEVLELAGFHNIVSRPGYPTIDLEELQRLDPEVLVLTHPLPQTPVWKRLKAVRNQRVLEISEDLLVRPGPRVVEALHRMQDWLELRQPVPRA
ncbi:MAG: ABC transporter substrate-binding protein [Candidatus Eremiobacteraeota bacterium]|nr:ABC transporter substrate-binding protein [Candidatus Eremiobacteraeota bacterium]MCW5867401.1 ABC transporter substrate-binding protein [Candidatus Eremiobacteraeota bacterium]